MLSALDSRAGHGEGGDVSMIVRGRFSAGYFPEERTTATTTADLLYRIIGTVSGVLNPFPTTRLRA